MSTESSEVSICPVHGTFVIVFSVLHVCTITHEVVDTH